MATYKITQEQLDDIVTGKLLSADNGILKFEILPFRPYTDEQKNGLQLPSVDAPKKTTSKPTKED